MSFSALVILVTQPRIIIIIYTHVVFTSQIRIDVIIIHLYIYYNYIQNVLQPCFFFIRIHIQYMYTIYPPTYTLYTNTTHFPS